MQEQLSTILDSLRTTWQELAVVLPRLLAAALVLGIGWLVAKGLRRAVVGGLRLLRMETAAERSGLEDFLLRGGIRFTAVTLVGQLVYWTVMLATAVAVFNLLGLPVATALLDRTSAYLPDLVAAVAIVVFGTLLARFLSAAVLTYLNNVGVAGANGIAFLSRAAILAFVALLALEQLRIGGAVLLSAFQLSFGGLCLGLALAFGLGGREWAAGVLARAGGRR